jgi:methyl-accepting chemotaxis protein
VAIINQFEETITNTLQIAQEGYDNSILMQMVSNQSQDLFDDMSTVVKVAYEQANSVRQKSKSVLELAHLVKLATNQQQTASRQVLQSVQQLSFVAQQFANNSITVASSADNLEDLSNELNLALVA